MEKRETYLPFGRPNFSDEEVEAVTRVLRSGWVGMGPEVAAFETELAAYVQAPHVVTVSSCTAALQLSLRVAGVGPGDEVICPSLTWCSSANVALYLGADVAFCDVDPDTLCVTPETVRAGLSERTRAVVVVHLGGLAADVEGIRAVLPPEVAIIEDAAHALGARYADDTPVGSSGNLTCFSFYANKNLSTGEGGAIAVFDEKHCERLNRLRQHGFQSDAWKRFTHSKTMMLSPLVELGYKANYTDLQAAIGRVQLRRMRDLDARRLSVANVYSKALPTITPQPVPQPEILSDRHARHLYLVQLPIQDMKLSRDELLFELRDRNIGATVHYAPLHQMPLYLNPSRPVLPVTEHACEKILTLPISSSMVQEDAEYVLHHLAMLVCS